MSGSGDYRLDELLKLIAQSTSRPWYLADLPQAERVDRKQLDCLLDELRLAGLIELTPWEAGRGQGLRVTPAGRKYVDSSRLMARLARGELPNADQADGARRDGPDETTTFGRGEAVRGALMFEINPRLTQILVGINVAVFLVGLVIAIQGRNLGLFGFGEQRSLVWTGAVSGDLLLEGQWWRLLTSCFVHIGIIHLFLNMYSLWVLGPVSERLWGRGPYLCIYLLAGIGGSCAAMVRHPDFMLAGASGCLWGLMAALLVWIVVNRSHLPPNVYSDWMQRLLKSFVMNAVISFMPTISTEAHFAGGVAGAIVAIMLYVNRFGHGPVRRLSLVVVALVPLVGARAVFWAKEHTLTWHKVTRDFNERPVVGANDDG
jgi:rhomboid protease GluP